MNEEEKMRSKMEKLEEAYDLLLMRLSGAYRGRELLDKLEEETLAIVMKEFDVGSKEATEILSKIDPEEKLKEEFAL